MISIAKPQIGSEEMAAVQDVLASGQLAQGAKVRRFEEEFAEWVGVPHAIAVTSGTAALHVALLAAGIGAGDDVVTSPFSFVASANCALFVGARPLFADIEPAYYTMDPAAIRAALTPSTRALIVVHLYGQPCAMDEIKQIAAEHNLLLVEDACQAHGAAWQGQRVGSMGVGCFSFYPTKNMTTGEGGMITTDDADLAERIQLLRSHGGKRTGYWYEYEEAGYNYRLSDILGAMGVAQMEKLDWLIERKRALAGELRQRMAHIPGVQLPVEPAWGGHIYQSFVTLLDDSLDRDRMVADLRAIDIESTLGTYAMHDQPVFQRLFGYRSGDLPNSHRAYRQSLTLPLYPQMEERDLDQLAAGLAQVVAAQRSK